MQQLEPHTFNRNGTATDDDFVTVSLDEEPDEGFDTIRPSTARRRGCRFKNSQATPSRLVDLEFLLNGWVMGSVLTKMFVFRWSRLSEMSAS
jgi:hypothetical protein